MATLAFGAAFAGAGPFGSILATSIGSYIDNTFLFPALFPQDPAEGPRISDLQLQATDEGAPVLRAFGAENRVPGTVIWTSGLKERENETGGKGGPSQAQTTYTYSTDCAVSFGEGPADGLGIVEFTKVWANTKTLYKEHPDVNVSDTTLSAVATTLMGIVDFPETLGVLEYILTIESPNGGPDLSEFRSGNDVVIAGWASAVNNGTFRCSKSWKDDVTGETFAEFRDETTVFVTDANGGANTITLDQTNPKFAPKAIDSVTLHKGTETQTADSLIQVHEDDVPAFRRTAYMVFDDLQLANYGNTLPNFNAQTWNTGTTDYTGGDPETVGSVFQQLLTLAKEDAHRFAGLSAITFDTTAIDAITLRGYQIRGPQVFRSILQPLMVAYDIAVSEEDGEVTFFLRKDAPVVNVTLDDLAAHPIGGDTARPFKVRERQGQSLPKEFVCRYIEPDKNYQQGAQRAKRLDGATGDARTVEVPLVLTAVEAKNIAERLLWTPAANRREVSLQLPPSYFTVQEGDVLSFTDAQSKPWRILVQKIDRGANHLVRIEGIEEVSSLLEFTSKADGPKPPENADEVYLAGEVDVVLLDECALRDVDVNQPGIYVATGLLDTSIQWTGATWYESGDDATYNALTPANDEAAIGTSDTALGDVADPDLVDMANTLRVTMRDAVLSSRDGDDVLAGANRIAIGSARTEVLGWEVATLISTNADGSRTYDLTVLHRGLAGTEARTGEHVANEQALLLTAPGVLFIPIAQSAIGVSRYYKSVPGSGDEPDFLGRIITQAARCVQPLTVAHYLGARQTNDDWELTWDRRTRLQVDVLADDELPLEEEDESYEIEVRNVSTGAFVALYTSTSPAYTYTSAQQTTDFGSPQATVRIAVFQMSAVVGRGKENEQTFTG